MRAFAAVACAIFLAGCASDSPSRPSGPVNVQLVLAPGESGEVANAGIQLRFDGVFGDSRCPADAICIQGGDAIVRVAVVPKGSVSTAYELHTGNTQPVRHDDLTIALENLSPYPFSSRTISPGEYRATLHVTR
jgi:hypothetical protein